MALAPPKKPVVSSVLVAGTMHEPSRSTYNVIYSNLRPGRIKLRLQLDPGNQHDPCAVKILAAGHQIGWVPKTLSRQVTQDIKNNGMLYAEIVAHDYHPDRPYDCRLLVDLWRVEGALPAAENRFIVDNLQPCDEMPRGSVKSHLHVGTGYNLRTHSARSSVTLEAAGGAGLVWFRKSDLRDGLNYPGLWAVVLQVDPQVIVQLLPKGQYPVNNLQSPLSGLIDGSLLAAGTGTTASIPLAEALEQEIPEASLGVKDVLTQTFTATKENTMSKFDSIIASNKSAAQTGAIMEAGRIANSQVAKLAAKQLPLMVRGYADTAIGKVIIANLAAQGAAYFRPEDARLAALTSAMMVQAFQVLMQTVDIEGFVDELLDSKDIKRAMSKLSEDGEEVAAPAARGRRAVAEK